MSLLQFPVSYEQVTGILVPNDMILNSSLVSNSFQSAMKKYLHEPVGIIEGLLVSEMKIKSVFGFKTLSFMIEEGYANVPYLYEDKIVGKKVWGSFLVHVESKLISVQVNNCNEKLYLKVILINNDGILSTIIDLSDTVDPNSTNQNSIEIGHFDFNVCTMPFNGIIEEGEDLVFIYNFYGFAEADYFNRLYRGEDIEILENIPHLNNLSILEAIDISSTIIKKDEIVVFSTEGIDFSFCPIYAEGSDAYFMINKGIASNNESSTGYRYILRVDSHIVGDFTMKISVSNDKDDQFISPYHKYSSLDGDGKAVYSEIFYFDDFTGTFYFSISNNSDSDIDISSLKIYLQADITENANGNSYSLNYKEKEGHNIVSKKRGEQGYGSESNFDYIPDIYINLPFTYDGVMRSLESYLSINVFDNGYMDKSWINGLQPYIVGGRSDIFVITPINMFSLYDFMDENDIRNYSFLRKGFPLVIVDTSIYRDMLADDIIVNDFLIEMDNEVIPSPNATTSDIKMDNVFRPVEIKKNSFSYYNRLFGYTISSNKKYIYPILTISANRSINKIFDIGRVSINSLIIGHRKSDKNKEISLIRKENG